MIDKKTSWRKQKRGESWGLETKIIVGQRTPMRCWIICSTPARVICSSLSSLVVKHVPNKSSAKPSVTGELRLSSSWACKRDKTKVASNRLFPSLPCDSSPKFPYQRQGKVDRVLDLDKFLHCKRTLCQPANKHGHESSSLPRHLQRMKQRAA